MSIKKVVMVVRCLQLSTGFCLEIPEPISEFIIRTTDSPNSARTKSNTMTNFLNFILHEVDNENNLFDSVKERGLPTLTWTHASEYLNYYDYVLNNSRNAVKSKGNTIKQLCTYLDNLKIL